MYFTVCFTVSNLHCIFVSVNVDGFIVFIIIAIAIRRIHVFCERNVAVINMNASNDIGWECPIVVFINIWCNDANYLPFFLFFSGVEWLMVLCGWSPFRNFAYH